MNEAPLPEISLTDIDLAENVFRFGVSGRMACLSSARRYHAGGCCSLLRTRPLVMPWISSAFVMVSTRITLAHCDSVRRGHPRHQQRPCKLSFKPISTDHLAFRSARLWGIGDSV